MRIIFLLSVLFISGSVFAQTYRSGGTYKANFGSQQAQGAKEGEKKAVAGAKSNVKTRTFTNYGSRQQWGKGVQTQAVQTATAGAAAPEPAAEAAAVPAAAKKSGAAAKKGASSAKAAPAAAAAQPAAAPEQQPVAMPAEAAAAMQQIQGMQEMLKSMGGAAGQQAGAAAPAMPDMAGMPDLSALMGGASAGKQAGKK